MQNKLFAVILSFLFTAGAISAQILNQEFVNPQTMQTWNNATSSYLDTVITNQINSNYFRTNVLSQMLFNQMMMDNLKTKFGKERIAKGQASTRFGPVEADSFITKSAENITNPQEKAKYIAANKELLNTFQKAMTQNGLTQNDVADGQALAFVIAYQVFTKESPGKQRLNSFRQSLRQKLMADVKFQGTLNDEKQPVYEQLGIQAILALYASNLAQTSNLSASDKSQANQTAKKFAQGVLEKIWGKSAGSIELTATGFGNKVERIAKQGGATVTFNRSAELLTTTRDFQEEQTLKKYVARFDEQVKKRGGDSNDLAFANAVAFDFSFAIVNDGKFLNAKQLKWINDEVANDITTKEKATYFQGLSDDERQKYYETLAIRVIKMVDEYNRIMALLNDQSGDSFARLTRASSVKVSAQNLRSQASFLMRDILSPRRLEDYELTDDGYRKIR